MNFIPEITLPLSNPVLILAVLMAVIFIAPQVATRFKAPGIVGLILSGALLGPSALNLLEHDPSLTPPGFMEVLGMLGLLYLMFQAGLSLDLNRFNKLRKQSLSFGLISFFIPQISAVLVAYFVLDFSLPASFLLGSIIGSHTLVAYPLIVKMGLLRNTPITMTLGGTLVTDTVSLAILAIVVASIADDVTATYWLVFAGMVSLFVFLVLWGLPRLGHLFFRTVQNRPEIEFGFLLTVVFATAWFAEFAGLAPIIGAFVAGLAMNRLVPEQSTMMARVRFIGGALFIPFFLIFVGLLIDLRILMESLDVWILAAWLIGLVTIGKLIAAKGVQHLFGFTSAEGWTMYGLSVPQAAATLAVTIVGFEQGLFDITLVNAVVVMILFTCILGPALVEKFGLIVAHEQETKPVGPREGPERILVPLANPETADLMFDMALLMHDPDSTEPIYPLVVITDESKADERIIRKQRRLEHVVVAGADAEIPVHPLTRIDINPAHGIARAAREEQASIIIIGWSGRVSTREKIFGTVLDQLLAETKQLVYVNRLKYPLNTTQKVVLVIPPFAERSSGFYEAVHNVKLLASRVEAELEVICLERYLEHDREFVESIEPEWTATYKTIEDWSDLASALDESNQEGMHIVALSARQRTAPWFPDLDGLPRMLATRYPDNSFSVVFLSEL